MKIPIYELFTKEDHIAPAASVFIGTKLFGGPVRYVMAGSGHIAGVINPPAKKKYQFWSGGRAELARRLDGDGAARPRAPGGRTGRAGLPPIRAPRFLPAIHRPDRCGRSRMRPALS